MLAAQTREPRTNFLKEISTKTYFQPTFISTASTIHISNSLAFWQFHGINQFAPLLPSLFD